LLAGGGWSFRFASLLAYASELLGHATGEMPGKHGFFGLERVIIPLTCQRLGKGKLFLFKVLDL
jgi:hypothetical protein